MDSADLVRPAVFPNLPCPAELEPQLSKRVQAFLR